MEQVTVKEKAPEAVGVPLRTPLEALSERPAGSEPAETDHVNVVGLPDAVKVCEYVAPTSPLAGAPEVIDGAWGAAVIEMLNPWVALGLTPLEQVTTPLKVPAAVGVPLSRPLEALRVRPLGNAPLVTVQVKAEGKPVAV